MADNGTILLDEIGEMTLRMQGLLLRFLETGEIQKVGAERVAKANNVRVMAATNRNLQELIAQGQFREDLYYRINVIRLEIPPLRERREDIPLLVDYFLKRFIDHNGASSGNGHGHVVVRAIGQEAMAALAEYTWPGNVRQVENVVERLVVTGRREVVQLEDLPHEVRVGGAGRPQRTRTTNALSPMSCSRNFSKSASRSGRRSIRST